MIGKKILRLFIRSLTKELDLFGLSVYGFSIAMVKRGKQSVMTVAERGRREDLRKGDLLRSELGSTWYPMRREHMLRETQPGP